ncbi:putative ABC transporter [Aspergillus japonicus CBS 114.51]|uniref:Putative ABC transporter n=1 Tax=Aspergillus japonicus CBS 114.51 TaxID=1448312 RepID=A0A8T8XB33_ASPJA|nr:putative ABC transporter [Aspergillus japonicus CBS 114.51]RAH84629.1 putative ABC transporter [Aspergillus japonicus CBS 114.51]
MPDESNGNISHVIFTRCGLHTTLLIIELCTPRCSILDGVTKEQSPEECRGLVSRTLFLWINPILLQGYRSILSQENVPPLRQDIHPAITRESILETWSQRVKPEIKRTLPMALYQCLKRPFLAAVVPRLFLLAFRYSQPILIKECIRYVNSGFTGSGSGRGAVLIVSALAIYGGLALSTAIYRHRINQLKLMTNSALVSLIYDKTMKSPSITYNNGEATTLMSTDADSLDGIAEMVHETWAQVVEVLIGIGLLASQVGWIWPLPLFLIYLCSHMSRFVAKHLQPRQKAWNSATQQRIGATGSLLSAMKGVKMLGIQHNLTDRIQQLREEELLAASKLRWVMVYYNASANALGIFSPAITVVIYALIAVARGGMLDTETAFTTMAILSMVTHPANMVMTIVPRAVAAFAGFERIQAFLLREDLPFNRAILAKGTHDRFSGDRVTGEISEPADLIQISQLRIGDEHPVLESITLDIAKGSFVIVSGPTGSGKTSLLRAILGEIVPAHGSINVSTPKVAYCAQKPWLPNTTIKKAIYGATVAKTRESEKWYHEVTEMCCLTHDFSSLPDGDQTVCGSGGLNLSGGQRQRVALARALFAKCDLLLLDDTFSGLDGDTEQKVFDNIFGPDGPVRTLNTTAVLVSNSAQYFQSADYIVVLGEHRIVDQGRWEDLKIKAASIEKFSGSQHTPNNAVLTAKYETLGAQLRAKDETEMDLARQTGDPALYAYYLRSIDIINLILLITTSASYSIFITIPQYWLRLWTESNGRNTVFYVGGFLFLSTISWMSTSVMMGILVIRIAPQSGKRLHQRLLDIVANAPLSYFSQTDNGSTLNRFSQDIQLIDKQLPTAFQTVMTQIFKLLMQIALLCIADKWLAVSLPACGLLVYFVQKVYLRTSRQLRLLELESRAGVFSSFLESIDGLETIRAYGWTYAAIRDNIQHLDHAQRPEYLLLCLRRWLSLVLDFLAAALATIVVATAVAWRGQVSGAQVGIALNVMLVTNTTLLSLVVSWTNLETSLGAIARLKSLEEFTPTEGGNAGSLDPPPNWPSKGEIEFDNVTVSYHGQSDAFALRNLSLRINAGQKLVICGRTGRRSTLILTLLRLLELQSGTIKVDGLNIRQVRLDLLRQRGFIAVSQDARLFPHETLRFNLDPDSAASDEMIAFALGKAGLWKHFSAVEALGADDSLATVIDIPGHGVEHPVLNRKVSSFPELSVGQCQLFAVCRALIKARVQRGCGVTPVVVLDEVTSSLDAETEATIHRIIDEEFTQEGHTVIVVAHRVEGLVEQLTPGRDTVAVMADGRLVDVVEHFNPADFSKLGRLE